MKEDILQKENELLAAMLHSDVSTLDQLIADDLLFTDHTGRVLGKQDDLEAHRNGVVGIDSIEPHDQKIQVYGTTAVVSVRMELKGHYMQEPFEGNLRFSRTWVKRNDSWQIVAGQATAVHQ